MRTQEDCERCLLRAVRLRSPSWTDTRERRERRPSPVSRKRKRKKIVLLAAYGEAFEPLRAVRRQVAITLVPSFSFYIFSQCVECLSTGGWKWRKNRKKERRINKRRPRPRRSALSLSLSLSRKLFMLYPQVKKKRKEAEKTNKKQKRAKPLKGHQNAIVFTH